MASKAESQSSSAKSKTQKIEASKVVASERKMDDVHPRFSLKTTAEKFKMNKKNHFVSYEPEEDAVASTDPLTGHDDSYHDNECVSHHNIEDHDNVTAIKSKPTMFKKEWKDLFETNKLHAVVKHRFCDYEAEDNQDIFNESQQELDLKKDLSQVIEILGHKRNDSCPSVLVRSDSGEEDLIKLIDMKSYYPL